MIVTHFYKFGCESTAVTVRGPIAACLKEALAHGKPVFWGECALRRRKAELTKAAMSGCSLSARLLRHLRGEKQ